MKYARIQNDIVAEIIETDGDIAEMYHPDIQIVPCSDPAVTEGYTYDGSKFHEPAPTDPAVYWTALRANRDALLNACDWTMMPDAPLSDSQKNAWKDYRQQLRSLPGNTTEPANPAWPTAPGGNE